MQLSLCKAEWNACRRDYQWYGGFISCSRWVGLYFGTAIFITGRAHELAGAACRSRSVSTHDKALWFWVICSTQQDIVAQWPVTTNNTLTSSKQPTGLLGGIIEYAFLAIQSNAILCTAVENNAAFKMIKFSIIIVTTDWEQFSFCSLTCNRDPWFQGQDLILCSYLFFLCLEMSLFLKKCSNVREMSSVTLLTASGICVCSHKHVCFASCFCWFTGEGGAHIYLNTNLNPNFRKSPYD